LIKEHSVSCILILHPLVVAAAVELLLLFSVSLGLERAWADSVIKTIAMSNIPTGVAFDSHNGYTYVTNVDSNTVSVIDNSTNTVIKNIPVGSQPSAITVNSDTGNVYVTNLYSNTISVIDGSTNTVVDTIPVAQQSAAKNTSS
jgi:YVTN family beta-propeller protein